jgi:hypothetical protein
VFGAPREVYFLVAKRSCHKLLLSFLVAKQVAIIVIE